MYFNKYPQMKINNSNGYLKSNNGSPLKPYMGRNCNPFM